MTEWLKIKSAALHADSCERTTREWLKKGLRHVRLPSGSIRIKKAWLDEFLMQFENTENQVGDLVDEVFEGLKQEKENDNL